MVALGPIYLDTCLVIYLAERDPLWSERVAAAIATAGTFCFAISPLVEWRTRIGSGKRPNSAACG